MCVCYIYISVVNVHLFGVFEVIIRFRNNSLIELRQQMKGDHDSFEVFNNIVKGRRSVVHVMPDSVGQ